MKKILILGCCGAGKSTFAKRLHAITKIELIHLDQHYWKPNWTESEPAEWQKTIAQLIQKPSWIMDGNYGGTLAARIKAADTILFLDYPTAKCLWRVITRTLKYKGTERPDMPKGCKERFDLEFLHYVATFNLRKRKSLLRQLESAEKENKQVRIFRTDESVAKFLSIAQQKK